MPKKHLLGIEYEICFSPSKIRNAIINELKYSFKKVYFRSYDIDDQKIKDTREWLSFHMFSNQIM